MLDLIARADLAKAIGLTATPFTAGMADHWDGLVNSTTVNKLLAEGYHRIASGERTWLCEGYATGLSVRAALRGLNRRDTVLVCFSASNIVKVASTVSAHFIAADHDAPPAAKPDQFNGLGAGEYFARKAGIPYLIPPQAGTDINDLHKSAGIFAVQRLITGLLRRVPP